VGWGRCGLSGRTFDATMGADRLQEAIQLMGKEVQGGT
jgi:hypothetical protein